MVAFASSDDVAARWRPLTAAEQDVVDTLLDDASDIIRNRWPDVDARITAGTLSESTVIRIVATMVKRAMLNTAVEGVEQQAQAAGPFSVSNKYTNPNANLFLNAEEIALFDGFRAGDRVRMGWLA